MTALSGDAAFYAAVGGLMLPADGFVVDSGSTIYAGSAVGRDLSDLSGVKPLASGSPMLEPLGVAYAKLLGDGTKKGLVTAGLFERENSSAGNAIAATLPLGWPLYAADDYTASLTDGGGIYPKLGVYGGWSKNGKPLVWIGMDPYGLREIVISVAKGHADLSDAAATMDFTLYTLPGPVVVVAPPFVRSLSTAFSGGGTGVATVAIGLDSDPDAIGDEKSIFTGGAIGAMTAGVNGAAGYPLAAGGVIKAQFAADTTVGAFTAGAMYASLRLKPGSY